MCPGAFYIPSRSAMVVIPSTRQNYGQLQSSDRRDRGAPSPDQTSEWAAVVNPAASATIALRARMVILLELEPTVSARNIRTPLEHRADKWESQHRWAPSHTFSNVFVADALWSSGDIPGISRGHPRASNVDGLFQNATGGWYGSATS